MCFFFFQAEDGIRDLVRSRGLGDVYKRQSLVRHCGHVLSQQIPAEVTGEVAPHGMNVVAVVPVSYTHLTLPTSDLV